jgi:hypothetical protein
MRTVEEWKRLTKDNHQRETKERMMEDQRETEPRRKRETMSRGPEKNVCPTPRFLSASLSNEARMLFCRNRNKRVQDAQYSIFIGQCVRYSLEKVFISNVKDPNVQFVRVRQDFFTLAIICPIFPHLNLILSNQMWFVRHRRCQRCQLSGPLTRSKDNNLERSKTINITTTRRVEEEI